MAGLVYGYLGNNWRNDPGSQAALPTNKVIGALKAMNADGVYCLDTHPDEELAEFAKAIRGEGMDFILGFRWPRRGRAVDDVDHDRLSRALHVTNRLALGNVSTLEWYGGMEKSPRAGRSEARVYLRLAKKHGFEWVCCVTHRTICHDIFDGNLLKPMLIDTPCICLCGYILAGYVYGDVRMPHQRSTSLGKQPLRGLYGLTAAKLKGWLVGMDCLTGAGFQKGIDGGSRVYAEALGFTGVCSGMPVDLTNSLKVDILPVPERPPERCGIWADYQNNELIRDGEIEWMPGGDMA